MENILHFPRSIKTMFTAKMGFIIRNIWEGRKIVAIKQNPFEWARKSDNFSFLLRTVFYREPKWTVNKCGVKCTPFRRDTENQTNNKVYGFFTKMHMAVHICTTLYFSFSLMLHLTKVKWRVFPYFQRQKSVSLFPTLSHKIHYKECIALNRTIL